MLKIIQEEEQNNINTILYVICDRKIKQQRKWQDGKVEVHAQLYVIQNNWYIIPFHNCIMTHMYIIA
jgi:hypothetical protein